MRLKTCIIVLFSLLCAAGPATAQLPPPPPSPDISITDSVAPVDDLTVPYGVVATGSFATQSVVVTNNGNANLSVGDIALANPLSPPFVVIDDTCSGKTMIPAETCTFTILFSPVATGFVNDSFDIPNNDPDENPVTISVRGTGIEQPVPDLKVYDSILPTYDHLVGFVDLTVGISLSAGLRIENHGTADLELYDIALIDPLAEPFYIQHDDCSNQTLSPLSSCTVRISFSPTSVGTYTETFDIPSNDMEDQTITVTVKGTALSSLSNNPPKLPQLVYPADGQSGLGSLVKFRWNKCSDPDLDNVNYYLYVSEDPEFINNTLSPVSVASSHDSYYAGMGAKILFFGTALVGGATRRRRAALLKILLIAVVMLSFSCGGGGSGEETGTIVEPTNNEVTMEVSGLTSASTYYWRVVADDGHGGVVQSEKRTFTTR